MHAPSILCVEPVCSKQMQQGLRPPSRPRSSFDDVALRDFQNCRISRPYKDAQDRLLWRDNTCLAHTHVGVCPLHFTAFLCVLSVFLLFSFVYHSIVSGNFNRI